jgi:benzoyl-CoA-dihydrodiol lyase
LPLLAVLPGTGGLTRLVDKRLVRRDHADFFCTTAEGLRGKRAKEWRLVDRLIPPSKLADETRKVAEDLAAKSKRPKDAKGIALPTVERRIDGDTIRYSHVTVEIDREGRSAKIRINGPAAAPPADIHAAGAAFWPLALARDLDDAMMHLRLNETEIGTWVLTSQGDGVLVEAYDALLAKEASNWLAQEIVLYWKRTLKRLDVSSRSLIALVEPGSCFTGTLLEIVLAADRSYMLDGTVEGSNLPAATLRLTSMNFGPYPMGNGLTRLATRFLSDPKHVDELKEEIGEALDAEAADEAGLVTFTPDDIDWDDEVRLAVEERAGFSPDGLIGMEANLRFAGPETMETKIFARLSAWQNWIFQRPNATGPEGALKLYGTGKQSKYDRKRA